MVKSIDVILLTTSFMLVLFIYGCTNGAVNETILLGDEVQTTDRYTDLFNDSFSGRVISIGDMYAVRDENGAEREFERHWLIKC